MMLSIPKPRSLPVRLRHLTVYGCGVWPVFMSGAGVCESVERSFARTCTVLGGEFLPRYPCRFFVVLFCFNDWLDDVG